MVLYEVLYEVLSLRGIPYEVLYEVPRLTTCSICELSTASERKKQKEHHARFLDGSSLAQAPHTRTSGGLAQLLLWDSSHLSCVQGEARAGAALGLPEG